MKFLHKRYRRLEDALKAAYFQKEEAEVSHHWRLNVMRSIRHMGPLQKKANPVFFMNWVAWRFAMVACVIVIMLAVYVLSTGFSLETVIVNLFFEDPVEFMIIQAFGGYY